MILTGINIRSGLELEIPVSEIFNVSIAPEGNIIAKIYFESDRKDKKIIKELKQNFEKDQFINYNDLKISHKLNETLICYVYDSYFIYEDENKKNAIVAEKTTELLFVNTDSLDYESFCANFMLAHSYSGNFNRPEFNYPFIGVGNFDLEEYLPLHPLCCYSNLNLVNFFIYHKNILSSIGYFICGLFENDIREQKKYINDQEYKQLLSLVKKHKKNLLNMFKNLDEEGFDEMF
jgi:hypothetical protein